MALATCPECQKELSDTALTCPHCGWHKSQAGTVIAVIAVLLILGLGLLAYYQNSETDKARANLQKELSKPVDLLKKLGP